MKLQFSLLRVFAPLLLLTLSGPSGYATPTTTQQITLNPGWNAIHVDVLPTNANFSVVFSGVDLDSVWAYGNDLGAPNFVQELSEETLARAGWFSWVPTNRVDAFQNTLFQLEVNRSYLVKYTGSASTTLLLSGAPTTRTRAWLPDAYNFRGMPVDPALPPTFLNFFKPSSAHYSTTTGLQPIYRLDSTGHWVRVAPTDLMRRGEAYWIYCKGGSQYVAPFVAKPTLGDGLDFGANSDELELNLQNLNTASLNATIKDLGYPGVNPLSYAERLADQTLTWPALPYPLVRAVAGATARRERIAARRADLQGDVFETVLEVTDGLGTRHMLPITVLRNLPETNAVAGSIRAFSAPSSTAPIVQNVGLWVGVATLNAVSEAHSGPLTTNISQGFSIELETNQVTRAVTTNKIPHSVVRTAPSMAPTPTGGDFNLRLLLHVDANGQTRLLKEVIEMWKNGQTTTDNDGNQVVVEPGRYVLVTNDKLIGNFTGVSARDGVPVGRRLSTAGFDFADNELPMSGVFAIGSSVVGTNSMSDTFARNPFKHKYHPDHQKGYDIKRIIGLEFSAAPTNAPPGYGERVLDGIYHETVTGLHRTNIVVSGTFRLNRIATTGVLNQ